MALPTAGAEFLFRSLRLNSGSLVYICLHLLCLSFALKDYFYFVALSGLSKELLCAHCVSVVSKLSPCLINVLNARFVKMTGKKSTWQYALVSVTILFFVAAPILWIHVIRGKDIAPSGNLSTEGIPKSVSRILDAAKIRGDFKQRKRTALDDPLDGSGRPKKKRKQAVGDASSEKDGAATNVKGKEKAAEIKIKPGETLAHFNR